MTGEPVLEGIARDLKAKASLTPGEALIKAQDGKLSTAEALEMGQVAAAYMVAGMRFTGSQTKISAQNLLRVCFDVVAADGELARLQWVEARLAELVKAWETPTRPGQPTSLDRGLMTAAGELQDVLEASHLDGDKRPPLPERTVLVLAIGHEIGSEETAARIQAAVNMAVNHPDWVDSMLGGE
jgi:hypothetical protein